MRYVQPYGEVDTNASYTNGNAMAGVPGSIPDARAIEHTQREIVAAITAMGLTPDENTLNQMATGIAAIIASIAAKAPVNAPTFTGDAKAQTAAAGDNDTSIATTAFVRANGATYGNYSLYNTNSVLTDSAYGNVAQINAAAVDLQLPLQSNNTHRGRTVTVYGNAAGTVTAQGSNRIWYGKLYGSAVTIPIEEGEFITFYNYLQDYWFAVSSIAQNKANPETGLSLSSGALNVGAQFSENVLWNGGGTLTGFGTIPSGKSYRVRAATSGTITHNGTSCICPGGANITVAANDTFEVLGIGSNNVIILNYKRQSGLPVVNPPGGGQAYAVRSVVTTTATISTATPIDDTIPQQAEMTIVATNTLVPKSSTSLVRNSAFMSGSIASSGNYGTIGIFKDSGQAIAASAQIFYSNGHPWQMLLEHTELAGSTVSRDYKMGIGSNGTVYTNGLSSGARLFGGVMPLTFTTEEFVNN